MEISKLGSGNYQTKLGKEVRILCVDGPTKLSRVTGYVKGEATPTVWDINGIYNTDADFSYNDLEEVPSYRDGIYVGYHINTDFPHTLKLVKGCWTVLSFDCELAELVELKTTTDKYKIITRIGDLPKEPTIADTISSVPNDFVPDWDNKHQKKWIIRYSRTDASWYTECFCRMETPGVTYFRTREEAQRVIEEVLS